MPKILVIDDDAITLDTLSLVFESYEPDYDIVTAASAEIGFSKMLDLIPDLVITDWEMPGMDGIQLIDKLKKHELLKDIPVIMTTGIMMSSENLKVALHSGANDFIRKPFDKVELLARTRSMLTLSRTIKELNIKNNAIAEYSRFVIMLIETVPQPIVYYSINGVVQGCNKKFEDIASVSRENLMGKFIYDCVHPGLKDLHLYHDAKLINDGGVCNYEGTTDDGATYLITKTLYKSVSNCPQGIICVKTDITELKRAHLQAMEGRQKELAASAMRLIQVSELNNKLITDLAEISKHANKSGKDLIQTLISDFNVLSNENPWKEFETRFENVYEAFYQKLKERHPDLTPGERKLCALLRLNLSSKEIAALTFQNPQSVDIGRYRIRKKLALSKETSLVSYLELI